MDIKMELNDHFKKIQSMIDAYQSFFLISHIHTDGDALGSILAFYHYLIRLGKKVEAAVPGEIPAQYKFLPGIKTVNRLNEQETLEYIHQAEVTFILDISALERMERWYEPVMQSKAIKICIDHHPGSCLNVDFAFIDDRRIATAEIIYEFFQTIGAELNKEIALNLYTGILSDSGSFRFEGTSTFTLAMAAELTKFGIDPARIYRQVYEHSNKAQLRFWGHVLSNIQWEDHIDWAVVTRQTMGRFGVTIEDMNGLVDIIRRDATADVFIMFVENSNKEIMVGLRSKNGFNVREIARMFGGGGHFHAAGFSSFQPMETVVEQTLKAIKEKQARN